MRGILQQARNSSVRTLAVGTRLYIDNLAADELKYLYLAALTQPYY